MESPAELPAAISAEESSDSETPGRLPLVNPTPARPTGISPTDLRGWPKPEANKNLARLRGAGGGNTGVAQRVTFHGKGGLPINPSSPGYIHSAEVDSATVNLDMVGTILWSTDAPSVGRHDHASPRSMRRG